MLGRESLCHRPNFELEVVEAANLVQILSHSNISTLPLPISDMWHCGTATAKRCAETETVNCCCGCYRLKAKVHSHKQSLIFTLAPPRHEFPVLSGEAKVADVATPWPPHCIDDFFAKWKARPDRENFGRNQ